MRRRVTLSGSTGSRHSRSGNTPNGLDFPALTLCFQPAVVAVVRGGHLRRVGSWFAGKSKGDKPTDHKKGRGWNHSLPVVSPSPWARLRHLPVESTAHYRRDSSEVARRRSALVAAPRGRICTTAGRRKGHPWAPDVSNQAHSCERLPRIAASSHIGTCAFFPCVPWIALLKSAPTEKPHHTRQPAH